MLSISGAMTAGDGLTAYFTGSEDYYMSSPGQWQGKGAAALGLHGKVSRKEFKLVAGGFSPVTGEQLVAGKEVTNEKGEIKYRRQAGNDLTFSADKSISIAAVIDPQIIKIHEDAVSRVVTHIEKNNTQARVQINGNRITEQTGNLVSAKFTHMTSRELDPQLHTHVFTFNMTQRHDGKWRALINRTMFQDKMALGKLYRNELAQGLAEAGYQLTITDRSQGFFRIQGVPKKLEELFSKRRQEIEDKVKDPVFQKMIEKKYPAAGKSTIYQIATLGTRSRKKKVTADEIRKHWQTEIENNGYNISEIKTSINKSCINTIQTNISNTAVNAIQSAIHNVTETDSIFTKTQILKAAADHNFGEHKLEGLDEIFHSCKAIRNVGCEHGREYYTSTEMLKIEESIIKAARTGKGQRHPLASPEEVSEAINFNESKNGWSYTKGQKQTIEALATSWDKIIIIQGDAGTGKTASMKVLKKIADTKGYTVKGLGFTGKSADELEKGAGICSQTIDSFLLESKTTREQTEKHSKRVLQKETRSGNRLTLETEKESSKNYILTTNRGQSILSSRQHKEKKHNKEIWLVDESSMTGSRHFAALLEKADNSDTTVVFIGDNKQFESISAGRMFNDLQQTIGVHARLTEIMRQESRGTKVVVSALNNGDIQKSFNHLESQGSLKEYKSVKDLRRATVQHYKKAAVKGKETAVISSSNTDRQELNREIKKELVRSGIVKQGKDHTILTPHNVPAVQAGLSSSYESKQTVQISKSFGRLKAGQAGKLTAIDHDKNTITIQVGNTEHKVNIDRHHSKLTFYKSESISLSQEDKIIFLKNDKKLGVRNGQTGVIKQIDSRGNVTVKTGNKSIRFSIADETKKKRPEDARYSYKHFDHGMAVTAFKSQGATVDNVIWYAPVKAGKDRQIDRRAAYVAATRAKRSFTVLTDDINILKSAAAKNRSKRSIADFEQKIKHQVKLKNIQNKIKSMKKETRSHKPRVNMEMGR